jgi:DNA-binding response OmpR family regulator
VEFRIERDSTLQRTIRADAKRIEQILKNLLSNAFKFTEKGSVTLKLERLNHSVRTGHGDISPDYAIAISVIDSGIGVAKEEQKGIFEAFQQADGSISRSYGGTGLGLTIARELAVLLGGEIQMRSQVGEGSTFVLYLPAVVRALPSRETPSQPWTLDTGTMSQNEILEGASSSDVSLLHASAWPAGPPFLADNRREIETGDRAVLIIEDDLNFAETLMNFARKKGYKCLVSDTGAEGLRLAEEYQPCGIILDIGLPDLNGITVLDHLKYNLRTRHIPVHVISAADERVLALQKGAIGYLQKPASLDALDAVFAGIEELFQRNIRKLLVVEDDEAGRKGIIDLIQNKGITITAVATGKDALYHLEHEKFDCIILDLNLPDMTPLSMPLR